LSSDDAANQRPDRAHSRIVGQRDEANSTRERVRSPPGRRIKASEQDQLVAPLAQGSQEEHECPVGEEAAAVGAVDEVGVDAETHWPQAAGVGIKAAESGYYPARKGLTGPPEAARGGRPPETERARRR